MGTFRAETVSASKLYPQDLALHLSYEHAENICVVNVNMDSWINDIIGGISEMLILPLSSTEW